MSCRACTNYVSEGHLRNNSRPLGFPTPREAWISPLWLPHLGTAFRRFQAEAPKWATKLPLEATELGAKSGNSLRCMPPYSESGRILLAEGSFGSRLRTLHKQEAGCDRFGETQSGAGPTSHPKCRVHYWQQVAL
jgi:hypothetical protein